MTLPAFLRSPLRPFTRTPSASAEALPAPALVEVPCPGCEAPVPGRFCGACGEPRASDDLSLAALLAGVAGHLTSLDERLLRTVGRLVARPGLLTAEYRRGVRARYTRPLQLFLLVTALFFVAVPYTGASYNTRAIFGRPGNGGVLMRRAEAVMRRTGETPNQFYTRFDRRTDDVKRGLLTLFVPGLAGALALLYAGRRRYAVEHFVFATHFFSFTLVLMAGWLGFVTGAERAIRGLARWRGPPGVRPPELPAEAVMALLTLGLAVGAWYLWAALRRAYASTGWGAVLRTVALIMAMIFGAALYEQALYRITLELM